MNPTAVDYVLSAEPHKEPVQQLDDLSATIRGQLRCTTEPDTETRHRFFDSFEWGLYRAGAVIEEATAEGHRELIWRDLSDPVAASMRQPLAGEPGLAADLPPGPLRERVMPLVGIRRLLPMAELSRTGRVLRVLNEDDKTVARIGLEQLRIPADAARPELALPLLLRLTGVRGYHLELEDVEHQLKLALTLEPALEPPYLAALAAMERRPGDYSSKLDYRLDPGQPAQVAVKTILSVLLETIEANVDGTKRNLDIEFLHDLRVATRRTRSALAQIKGVLPQAVVDDFKARFAWLQQVTGPVRDLDVYLLDFPRLKDDLPAPLRSDLEPLKAWLLAHYDAEQQALALALDSERFRGLLADWRAVLASPPQPDAKDAATPIKAVADKRIRRMFKRVRREGRAIDDASEPEALHELRKSCKKLRYLMEFCQSLYPSSDIKGLIKQLKVLLDNLGGFQDLAVQAQHLRQTAAVMQAEGAAPLGALLSMGALIGHMLEQQQRARQEFARIFAGFDSDDNAALFRRLFADDGAESAKAKA